MWERWGRWSVRGRKKEREDKKESMEGVKEGRVTKEERKGEGKVRGG